MLILSLNRFVDSWSIVGLVNVGVSCTRVNGWSVCIMWFASVASIILYPLVMCSFIKYDRSQRHNLCGFVYLMFGGSIL